MAELSNIKITDITDNQKIIKLLEKNFISFDIERFDENEIEITPLWDDYAEQDSYTLELKENEKLSDKEFLAFIERFIDDFDMEDRFGDYLSDDPFDRIGLNNIEKDLEKMNKAYSLVKEAITNDRDYYLSKEPFTPLSSISIANLSAEQAKQITEEIINSSNKLLKQYYAWAYSDLCFTPKEILGCDKIFKHIESCRTDLFLNDEKKNVALKDMDDDELLSYAQTCQEYGIDSMEAEKVLAKHYVEKVQYALLDFDISNIDLSNKEKQKSKGNKPKILDTATMSKDELFNELKKECGKNQFMLEIFDTIAGLDKNELLNNYADENIGSIVRDELGYLYDEDKEAYDEIYDDVLNKIGGNLALVVVANLLDKDELSDAELAKVFHNEKLRDPDNDNQGDLALIEIRDFATLIDELKKEEQSSKPKKQR